MNDARMDLQGELGYAPDASTQNCAAGCHSANKAAEWTRGSYNEFMEGHKKHREEGAGCGKCHSFVRN